MILKAAIQEGKKDREDMYQLERRYRAMSVVERAIEIALNKGSNPKKAATRAASAFRAGLTEFENSGIKVEEL